VSIGLALACREGWHAINNMLARGCVLVIGLASKGLLLLSDNIHAALGSYVITQTQKAAIATRLPKCLSNL